MTRLFGMRRQPRRRGRRAPGSLTDGHPTAELLERELQVAQRIQRTLVLLSGIEAEGWEIASDYRPARSIGGDFFDVFPLIDQPPRGWASSSPTSPARASPQRC